MKCPLPSSPCLTDSELVKKLLAFDPKATTAKMLETLQGSHSHSRQPLCYGTWIKNCQCCQQMEQTTSVMPPTATTENIKTTEPTCM